MQNESLGKQILLRFNELAQIRLDYERGLWIDICRFVNPRREDISQDTFNNLKGQRKGKDVYDGTPLSALNTWADGMQGHIVSESLDWFKSETDNVALNREDDIIGWLQEYDDCMYSAFRRSNFYSVLGEWFRDAGSVGTAILYAEEDIKNRRTVFTCINPREIFIAENLFGEVDTVFRKFKLTARAATQKFDTNKLSEKLVKNSKEHPNEEHEFIHAVFPNTDRWPDKKNARNKPIRSVYLEVGASQQNTPNPQTGNVVRDSGYDVNPYIIWRFRKNSDEVYGYSPAADAIVEVFALNQLGKDMLEASHKSVDPPLNIPEEMRGNVRITPHGYNYYSDPKKVISPVMTGINYPIGVEQQNRLKQSLEDKYRVYFFQFLLTAGEGRERTAEEIVAMKSQQAVLLGPQVGRLINEGLKRVFDIVSEIEDRAGRLPPAPAILYQMGTELNINFIGPLAQAQKRLFKLQPIREGLNELAPFITIFPEMKYKIKPLDAADEILESANFPESLTRSNDEAEEMYNAELAAKAQSTNQMKLLEAAKAYPGLVKKPETGSPAESIGKQLGM